VHHIRTIEVDDGVYAYYDGRVEGYRFAPGDNWVDAGALSLGIASYALVAGRDALVYDTHVSLEHARFVCDHLRSCGVRTWTVVLSHWHLDHVAGTAAFGDSEIIASARTAELLARHRTAIESGEHGGPPAISPLRLPTRVFDDRLRLAVGELEVELIHTNIHSDDATMVWLPERRLLLCGDTMEDTVTYVDEPQHFTEHLANLDDLRRLVPRRILPNHGDPAVIASGGYESGLIDATCDYIKTLQRCRTEPSLRDTSLRELIASSLDAGSLHYYPPYEPVHRHNVEAVMALT
jgi:cyclase